VDAVNGRVIECLIEDNPEVQEPTSTDVRD
jgi:hypothetical protein